MTKVQSAVAKTVVRDSRTGQLITVRGAGEMKGYLKLDKNVDLTKPIASQAIGSAKYASGDPASAKR